MPDDYEERLKEQEQREQADLERRERSQGREERNKQLRQREREFRHPRSTTAKRWGRTALHRVGGRGGFIEAAAKTTRRSYEKTQQTMRPTRTHGVVRQIAGSLRGRSSQRVVIPDRGGGLGQRIVREMSENYVEHLDRDYFGTSNEPRDLIGSGTRDMTNLVSLPNQPPKRLI